MIYQVLQCFSSSSFVTANFDSLKHLWWNSASHHHIPETDFSMAKQRIRFTEITLHSEQKQNKSLHC